MRLAGARLSLGAGVGRPKVGGLAVAMTIVGHLELEYREGEHGFFPELVRLVIALSGIGLAFELHNSGARAPYRSDQSLVLEGKPHLSGIEIHFFPGVVYKDLLGPEKIQTKSLRVVKRSIAGACPDYPIKLNKLQRLWARLVGDAFVSYYERHVAVASEGWGRMREDKWPSAWRFGRMVRNACAHDGRISFKSEFGPSVTWRTLRFDFRDNGRQLLFDELSGVELILLMEDMDSELRKEMAARAGA